MLNKASANVPPSKGRVLSDYAKFRKSPVRKDTIKANSRWTATNLLRSAFLSTLTQREILLDRWRDGNPLSESQKQAVWVLLSDLVYSRSRQHFGQRQPYGESRNRPREWHDLPKQQNDKYDLHTDRMLLLAEWLKAHNIHSEKPRSAGWCIQAWKLRFSNFEAIRELRQKGVAVDFSLMQQAQVRVYITFKEIRRVLQERGDEVNLDNLMTEWLVATTTAGVPPSDRAIEKIEVWFKFFLYIQSYISPISLDSYESPNEDEFTPGRMGSGRRL